MIKLAFALALIVVAFIGAYRLFVCIFPDKKETAIEEQKKQKEEKEDITKQ